MNAKLRKLVKITAVGLFLIALAINVKMTLEDPFTMVNESAVAQTTTVIKYRPLFSPCQWTVVCEGKTLYGSKGMRTDCIRDENSQVGCIQYACNGSLPICDPQ